MPLIPPVDSDSVSPCPVHLILAGSDCLGCWTGVHSIHVLGSGSCRVSRTSGLPFSGGWRMAERECPRAEDAHPLLLGVENGTALRRLSDAAVTFSQRHWRRTHSKPCTHHVWNNTTGFLNFEARLFCEEVDKIAMVCPVSGILLCAEKELPRGSSLHIRYPPWTTLFETGP